MIVMVTGGRDYADRERVFEVLDKIHGEQIITEIVQGGAPGADSLAKEWAKVRGVTDMEFQAEWKRFHKAAGHIRNQSMVDYGPQICVAFPGDKGTADAKRRASLRRITILEVTKTTITRHSAAENYLRQTSLEGHFL